MLDERKTAILKAVVEAYVGTGVPVGSSHVARSSGLPVSPATVRNEMAALEQDGYLSQPHTSAGRIPTDKGYRAFVDTLAAPGRLDEVRVQEVRSFFDTAHGAIERMLLDTSRLLTRLTDHVAVVIGPGAEAATIRSVQLVGLSARSVLAVAVLSTASIDKALVELDHPVSDEHLAAATARLSAHLVGTTLGTAPAIAPSGDHDLDALIEAVLAALGASPDADEQVFLGGASRMAEAFDAVATVRQVLTTLEQQYVVVSMVRDVLDRGLSVAIGAELGVEPLAACSVVVAPYVVEGEQVGSVGVLGPTRMNYPQALAAVEVVSERLGRRLSEG